MDAIHRLDCRAAFSLGEGSTLGPRSSGLRLRTSGLIDDPFALARGEERPSKPIEFVRAEGRVPHDLIGTTYAVLTLVSEKFRSVLEDHGFTEWTTFPVEIVVDGNALPGYEGLAVTGRCGAIDDDLSERVIVPPPVPGGAAMPHFRGLCWPPESWDGSDLFMAENYSGVFVVERVKDALEAAGITNVAFRRLSEVERMWKADGSLLDDE